MEDDEVTWACRPVGAGVGGEADEGVPAYHQGYVEAGVEEACVASMVEDTIQEGHIRTAIESLSVNINISNQIRCVHSQCRDSMPQVAQEACQVVAPGVAALVLDWAYLRT